MAAGAAGTTYFRADQGVCTANFDHHDVLGDLFVLPSQLPRRSAEWSGEKRLMLAILEDAIACLAKPPHKLDYVEAWRWLRSHDRRSIFSFESICQHLGLNIQRTRALLLQPHHNATRTLHRWRTVKPNHEVMMT